MFQIFSYKDISLLFYICLLIFYGLCFFYTIQVYFTFRACGGIHGEIGRLQKKKKKKGSKKLKTRDEEKQS